MKKTNNFQIAKIRLLSFCLIFCQFQPGVAYKSVANKNKLLFETTDQIPFKKKQRPNIKDIFNFTKIEKN